MTRKRFVKLLMARGYSRNRAQRCTQRRPSTCSYAVYYPIVINPFSSLAVTGHLVADALERLAAAVSNFCTTVEGGDAHG